MDCGNLYVHFPFCRTKCSYCALYSRPSAGIDTIRTYPADVAQAVRSLELPESSLNTVYFGGGTPALCDLRPVFAALAPLLRKGPVPTNPGPVPMNSGPVPMNSGPVPTGAEFTVELHPLDVTPQLLDTLAAGGVNRISLGVQSLDDDILRHMQRGYDSALAERAFSLVKKRFDNAGIDLIVGYPGEKCDISTVYKRLGIWGLTHCSVYSLQNERNLKDVPDDEFIMDRITGMARLLDDFGLKRYEISNYAIPGYECRHNLAVWRGEDYIGLGDGACGRIGRRRTRNFWGLSPRNWGLSPREEEVEAGFDEKERRLFRLRTREGLDATGHPEWGQALEGFERDGLLERTGDVWRLTARGMEVCDTILAELV